MLYPVPQTTLPASQVGPGAWHLPAAVQVLPAGQYPSPEQQTLPVGIHLWLSVSVLAFDGEGMGIPGAALNCPWATGVGVAGFAGLWNTPCQSLNQHWEAGWPYSAAPGHRQTVVARVAVSISSEPVPSSVNALLYWETQNGLRDATRAPNRHAPGPAGGFAGRAGRPARKLSGRVGRHLGDPVEGLHGELAGESPTHKHRGRVERHLGDPVEGLHGEPAEEGAHA